jgi:hypothetical protein
METQNRSRQTRYLSLSIQEAVAAYRAGMLIKAIRDKYGLTRTALRHHLKQAGVLRRPSGRPKGTSIVVPLQPVVVPLQPVTSPFIPAQTTGSLRRDSLADLAAKGIVPPLPSAPESKKPSSSSSSPPRRTPKDSAPEEAPELTHEQRVWAWEQKTIDDYGYLGTAGVAEKSVEVLMQQHPTTTYVFVPDTET